MVNRYYQPTRFFWNCVGCSLVMGSIGISISVARTETLQLELARYKLKTGTALVKVQEASKELEEKTSNLPLDNGSKNQIKQKIRDADRYINDVEHQLDRELDILQGEQQ